MTELQCVIMATEGRRGLPQLAHPLGMMLTHGLIGPVGLGKMRENPGNPSVCGCSFVFTKSRPSSPGVGYTKSVEGTNELMNHPRSHSPCSSSFQRNDCKTLYIWKCCIFWVEWDPDGMNMMLVYRTELSWSRACRKRQSAAPLFSCTDYALWGV